jgi:hypothetical protein
MSRLQMVAILAFLGSTSYAQERRDENPSFDGQFLTVIKKSNPATSIELGKVQLRTLGGKAFLVGIGADTPDNWQKGKAVWVALDDVAEITAFATLDELRKAVMPPKKDGGDK